MLNKVVESMLGTSVEQKFKELQVEELRAERQAEIERQMKDKGKGVEGSSAVSERSIVPSMVVDNLEPITEISGLFEEETHLEELMGNSDDEDDEEEDEEEDDVTTRTLDPDRRETSILLMLVFTTNICCY